MTNFGATRHAKKKEKKIECRLYERTGRARSSTSSKCKNRRICKNLKNCASGAKQSCNGFDGGSLPPCHHSLLAWCEGLIVLLNICASIVHLSLFELLLLLLFDLLLLVCTVLVSLIVLFDLLGLFDLFDLFGMFGLFASFRVFVWSVCCLVARIAVSCFAVFCCVYCAAVFCCSVLFCSVLNTVLYCAVLCCFAL